jgi:hypothetical protein
MKINLHTFAIVVFATVSAVLTSTAHAHPGHEPGDIFHAIAHALMSPRTIIFLLIASAAVVAWRWYAGANNK